MDWKQSRSAAIWCLVLTATVHAQEGPAFTLPKARMQGLEAIQAMGDRLPDVARSYALSTEDLTTVLIKDSTAWVNSAGRLFYVEPPLPPGLAQGGGSGAAGATATTLSELATFQLHSHPSATKVIYLDFDGEYVVSPSWNGGNPIDAQPYDIDGAPGFSSTELARIQGIWQRVAEDFAPFDVDVTTEAPSVADLVKSGSGDTHWGIRVVITPTADWFGSAGGVAYYDSFNWGSDTPCWVFSSMLNNGDERDTAEASSHEVGHSLNLRHDGVVGGETYYAGHGSGAIGWGSIMGVGYYQPSVQWSKGEYPNANNTEDDLNVIVTLNGFGYRSDDHGDDGNGATDIQLSSGAVGVIETSADVDVFAFDAGAGPATIDVDGDSKSSNLDIRIELRDANGTLLASSNPADQVSASLSLTLGEGIHTLHVTGVGNANCSDYASLGQFVVTGSVVPPGPRAPTAQAGASVTEAEAPIAIQFSSAASSDDGAIVAYAWAFGDGDTSSAPNPSHVYDAPGTYTATLSVTDDQDLSDSATIVITVSLAAPKSLSANAAGTSIDLTWVEGGTEDGFYVESSRKTGANSWGPFAVVAVLAADTTEFSDVVNSGDFRYRVRAFSGADLSAYSNTASSNSGSVSAGGSGGGGGGGGGCHLGASSTNDGLASLIAAFLLLGMLVLRRSA